MGAVSTQPKNEAPGAAAVAFAACAVLAIFVWAFWHTFVSLWGVWQSDPDYSAGQLVPLAAAYMLWTRRDVLRSLPGPDARRWPAFTAGGLIFAAGVGINLAGIHYLFASLEHAGMILAANGLAVALLGASGYRRLWYPFVFLALMAPLPGRVHDAIMLPLQGFMARIGAGVLEIIGVPVQRFGHMLEVAGHQVAVAEACNGLRMAMAFLIVAAVVAYVVDRPLWQRVTLIVSSVPIALVCNVVRIVATAWLYHAGNVALAQGLFHDAAGFLMMPVALLLLLAELWLLPRLVRGDGSAHQHEPAPASTTSGAA